MHKHIVLVDIKEAQGRVSRPQYSETSFATHDLKNEMLSYILSANQRLAKQRPEPPIANQNHNSQTTIPFNLFYLNKTLMRKLEDKQIYQKGQHDASAWASEMKEETV